MRNIGLIIMREFKERVYKKSFIITTLLMPLLLALVSVAPTLIMIYAKGDTKSISVIDNSGIVAQRLESNEDVEFVTIPNGDLQEELKKSLESDNFGLLYIGEDIVKNPNNIQLYTNSSSSMLIEDAITDQIEEIIEAERLKEYNISDLKQILESIEVNISLSTFRNDSQEQTASSSAADGLARSGLSFSSIMFRLQYPPRRLEYSLTASVQYFSFSFPMAMTVMFIVVSPVLTLVWIRLYFVETAAAVSVDYLDLQIAAHKNIFFHQCVLDCQQCY